jgi:OOP family OmpA-OmpF porin
MKKQVPIVLLACLFAVQLSAQGTAGFKGVALGPTVNTIYDETQPRLSPDDSRLYFVRGKHPENGGGRAGGQDIWYSERQPDGTWSAARNIGTPLNNPQHNGVGAVLDGGNTLLLLNQYLLDGAVGRPGISRSRQIQGVWSNPANIFAHPLDEKAEGNLSFHAQRGDGPIVLSYVPAAGAKEDLFVLLPNSQGGWQAPLPLGNVLNTAGMETAPFLSADGRSLYFSSDGHGGSGGGDIFLSQRLDDSWTQWSAPLNLGPAVNTAGFDGHFIVDAQGAHAFFVSGPTPQALGDIYTIALRDIPALAPPVDISDTLLIFTKADVPVPFSLESFGVPNERASLVTVKSTDGQGQLIQNRSRPHFQYSPAAGFSGTEVMQLAYCDPPQADKCKFIVVIATVQNDIKILPPVDPLPEDLLIAGRVFDEGTGQPMEAEIEFFAQPGDRSLGKIKSDPLTGHYELRLPGKATYTIAVNQTYYFPVSETVDPGKGDLEGRLTKDIPLTPLPIEVGQSFVLKDIYFDLDKSILKPESRAELQRLYNLLVQHPTMEIAIQGHTDNWASDDYNIRLSQSRATAVVNYLKFMGVMGARMSAKGFGEAKPIATNETEEGRALNRRVEFVIVKK